MSLECGEVMYACMTDRLYRDTRKLVKGETN